MLILVILAVIYISVVFVVLTYAFEFKRKLKNRLDTLSIISLSKRTALLELSELYPIYNVNLGRRATSAIELAKEFDLSDPKVEKVREFNKNLNYLEQRLYYLAISANDMKEDPRHIEIINRLKEINNQFAKCSVAYNYDVLGYNYWVKFSLTYFICYLLRFKKAEVVS